MIRLIKPIYYLLFLYLFILTGCQNESKVFVGEWQDAREPGNKWEITKSGSTFIGKRVSGEDTYKYESEEWSFEIGDGGFPTLKPNLESGSTVIFQPKQNRILRSPPGRTYIKVVKE